MSLLSITNLTFAWPGSYDNVFTDLNLQLATGSTPASKALPNALRNAPMPWHPSSAARMHSIRSFSVSGLAAGTSCPAKAVVMATHSGSVAARGLSPPWNGALGGPLRRRMAGSLRTAGDCAIIQPQPCGSFYRL